MAQIAAALRTLDLSGNKIEEIPPRIGTFTVLRHLTKSKNRLGKFNVDLSRNIENINFKLLNLICEGSVPAELGHLIKLETLVLSSNKLTTIPASLSKLKNLKIVNMR